ncbi:MAG TPA: hypothetical protein VLT79_05840 [Gemmatimonadales bacterium]|nr:hypothetical protein [Gemmatimonadales bacterium]
MRVGVFVVGIGAVLACGNPAALNTGHSTQIVATDFEFAPDSDTVAALQNITFQFPSTDTATHNVTWINAPPGATASGDRRPGSTPYTVYVGQPGTYVYYCRFHGNPGPNGTAVGMAGVLVVTP